MEEAGKEAHVGRTMVQSRASLWISALVGVACVGGRCGRLREAGGKRFVVYVEFLLPAGSLTAGFGF